MLLTIDVGNSNTVCVVYDESKMVQKIRFETTADSAHYHQYFEKIFGEIHQVVLACVVPRYEKTIVSTICAVFGLHPLIVTSTSVPSFKSKLDNPNEIGADFIASTLGGQSRVGVPCIIVDIGSATKVTAIDSAGFFKGGAIIPGLAIAMKAMIQNIPHLPSVSLEFPPHSIGANTVHALQSGCMVATLHQINGLVSDMKAALNCDCPVVLTGGFASLFKDRLNDYVWMDDCVNEGLRLLWTEGLISND